MSRTEAIRIAVMALKVSCGSGYFQGEPFDSALDVLERYYNPGETMHKYFNSLRTEEEFEEEMKKMCLVRAE
jgi:hypothetical protein